MRIDFYQLPNDSSVKWDITEEGTSLLTSKESIIFHKDVKRSFGVHVDPEIAIANVDHFPTKRTRFEVIKWLIRSRFFKPHLAMGLYIQPTSKQLEKCIKKSPRLFHETIRKYTSHRKSDFDFYLRDSEYNNPDQCISEADPSASIARKFKSEGTLEHEECEVLSKGDKLPNFEQEEVIE